MHWMSSRLLVVPSDVNCLNIGGGLSPTGILWQKYPLLLMFFISEDSSFSFCVRFGERDNASFIDGRAA
jgi:hypothetical protein